jgi:septum formation protein
VAPVRFILASASPRRSQLLEQLGIEFEVQSADVDESIRPGEAAAAYVERLAGLKAGEVAARSSGSLTLGADTAVAIAGEVLGKPQSADAAYRMLTLLSGRSHRVLTGIALAGAQQCSRVVETEIDFRALSTPEIDWYIRTGEPMDKAGAYGAQGIGSFLIHAIRGSYSNVVGLPLEETLEMLSRAGVPLPWSKG